MEEQEHKISSYIEQQEDMKSMVSSFMRCGSECRMNMTFYSVQCSTERTPGISNLRRRPWALNLCQCISVTLTLDVNPPQYFPLYLF